MTALESTVSMGSSHGAQPTPTEVAMGKGAAEPAMGVHWIDSNAPELNGGEFTETWIHGTYDGKVIFYEPMLTYSFLKSITDWSRSIPRSAKVQVSGYYFSRVLELEEYLLREHYLKYNLRFYWKTPGRANDTFEDYSQAYIQKLSNIASYQLDRNARPNRHLGFPRGADSGDHRLRGDLAEPCLEQLSRQRLLGGADADAVGVLPLPHPVRRRRRAVFRESGDPPRRLPRIARPEAHQCSLDGLEALLQVPCVTGREERRQSAVNVASAAWLANRYAELGYPYWHAWSCKRVLY